MDSQRALASSKDMDNMEKELGVTERGEISGDLEIGFQGLEKPEAGTGIIEELDQEKLKLKKAMPPVSKDAENRNATEACGDANAHADADVDADDADVGADTAKMGQSVV